MISKKELALQYYPGENPKIAVNKLMRIVHHCPTLMDCLTETHYTKTQKLLFPEQVKLIMQHLGEP